jgi:cytochrome c-type biogenesis protein CcmE
MKRSHIIILIGIAILIVSLIVFSVGDFSTYETIASAQKKPGKSLTIIAQFDKERPIEYDPQKNSNYLAFYAKDSLGGQTKVVYHNSKPTDLEKSERIVLTGVMKDGQFECSKILLKCPSKYKDDKKELERKMNEQTGATTYNTDANTK